MDGFRISKGFARWTSTFTPSVVREQPDQYTKFLLSSDPTLEIKDTSSAAHLVTLNGSPTIDSEIYKLSIQQVITDKVVIKCSSITDDPSTLTDAQKQAIIDHPENYNEHIACHINGTQLVTITGMTNLTVTYIDPANLGAGSTTISKSAFLKIWSGDGAHQAAPAVNVIPTTSTKLATMKILTSEQMMKIRGAFFVLLIPMFIAIFSGIGAAIASIMATIGAIVASIGTFIGTIFSTIGQMIGGLGGMLQGFGASIWQGISYAASSLWSALGNVGSFLSQNVFGSLAKASFGNTLFQTAVKVGINFATTKGLDALGVNPVISNLVGAFVTGGSSAFFEPKNAFNMTSFLMGGIKGVALTGSQTLLQKVGLDPMLSQTLSLITSPLIDGIQAGNIGGELVKIIPKLSSSLALYGIEKLGTSLGLDPRISSLIGAPVSGAINGAFEIGGDMGQNIIAGIENGISRGVVSLGIEYATQAADLDPLLAGLTSRAITGAIEGALGGGDVFGGIYRAFRDSVLNIGRLGISGDDPWSQAQYLQRCMNFSDIIRNRGLAQAIEDTAAQVLTEDSISSILRTTNPLTSALFRSVGEFFQYVIGNNQLRRVQVGSNFYKDCMLSNGDYLRFSDNLNDLVEVKHGARVLSGQFAMDQNWNFGLRTGHFSDQYGTDNPYQIYIVDGMIKQALIFDPNQSSTDPAYRLGNLTFDTSGSPFVDTCIRLDGSSASQTGNIYQESYCMNLTMGELVGILGVPIGSYEAHQNFVNVSYMYDASTSSNRIQFSVSDERPSTPLSDRIDSVIGPSLVNLKNAVRSVIDEPQGQAAEGIYSISDGLSEMTAAIALISGGTAATPSTAGASLTATILGWGLWLKGTVDISDGMDLLRDSLDIPEQKVNLLENLVGTQNSQLYNITDDAYSTYEYGREFSRCRSSGSLFGGIIINGLRFFVDFVEARYG